MPNFDRVVNFFLDLGLSPAQAAGFTGNLQQESSLDPTAVGDGGKSFGIAQFQGSRRKELERFAKRRGTDPSDLDTQLDFIAQEFQTTEKPAFTLLRQAQTPEDAAEAGVSFFRPGKPRTERRIRFAREVFDRIQNEPTSAPIVPQETVSAPLTPSAPLINESDMPNQVINIQPQPEIADQPFIVQQEPIVPLMAQQPVGAPQAAPQQAAQPVGLLDRIGNAFNSPLFNVGAGLLSVAGESTQPRSIGEGLLIGLNQAQNAQGLAAKNELRREQIRAAQEERARRERTANLIGGLLDGDSEGLLGNLSEGQRQAVGLLAQANPEAALGLLAESQFQQERAEPAVIRSLKAIGVDPASAEGREIVIKDILGDDTSTNEQMEMLLKTNQVILQNQQIQSLRDEREKEQETETKARRNLEVSLRNDLDKARELAQLNQELEGTILETGNTFLDARRAAAGGIAELKELFGSGSSQAREVITKFDRFNKLATDFAIESIDRLRSTGAITNTKFEALRSSLADIGTSSGANNLVIADTIKTLLDAAEIEGVEIPEREKLETLVKQLKGMSENTENPSPSPKANKKSSSAIPLGGGATLEFN